MAKKQRSKLVAPLSLGDHVRIKNYAGKIGQIVELRGALGPDGASVYRVLVNRRPTASYIELLDDQLEAVSAAELERMRSRRVNRGEPREGP